jgi:pimeloyl-ACP methyl ester carboxylesterase
MSYLEVAQITSDAETGNRVVHYRLKGSPYQTRTIDCLSPLMEPLCYPILFNHGEWVGSRHETRLRCLFSRLPGLSDASTRTRSKVTRRAT